MVIRNWILKNKKIKSLYLKIGGVETLRDIKDAIERRVDSLMAPMFISLCALNPSF